MGSWRCCLPGYQLGEDGETCLDIDECQPGEGPGCQETQSCFNTPGSFVCCEGGFQLAGDGLTCTDIDECEDPAVCPDRNKQCRNTEGNFTCICVPFSYDDDGAGDCRCNQGEQATVCQTCDPGAVLITEKHRTFCLDQVTECEVATEGLKERLREFPNYEQVTRGYNILKGEMVDLPEETNPGTNSHIFSVVRKDHSKDNCSFQGYNADTAKICQDNLLKSLAEFDQGLRIEEVEVTYEESEAVKFTNSFSFGVEVNLPGGNEACVDRAAATSAEIGETLENNGLTPSTTSGFERLDFNVFTSSDSINYHEESKQSNTTLSTRNEWSPVKSRSDPSETNINTRFCEAWIDGDEGNRTSEAEESLHELKITKSFSLPGCFDFVKNSASFSEAENVSSGKCRSYKLEIDANNPPSFTEEFKVAVRSLHDLTVETRPYRLIVVKAGPREFNTTLNTTTEGRFDSAFSEFIRELSKIYIS